MLNNVGEFLCCLIFAVWSLRDAIYLHQSSLELYYRVKLWLVPPKLEFIVWLQLEVSPCRMPHQYLGCNTSYKVATLFVSAQHHSKICKTSRKVATPVAGVRTSVAGVQHQVQVYKTSCSWGPKLSVTHACGRSGFRCFQH